MHCAADSDENLYDGLFWTVRQLDQTPRDPITATQFYNFYTGFDNLDPLSVSRENEKREREDWTLFLFSVLTHIQCHERVRKRMEVFSFDFESIEHYILLS